MRPASLRSCVFLLSTCGLPAAWGQSVNDQIGFTQLQAEVGPGLVDGSGIRVGQVEAPSGGGAYFPNVASPEFTGKTFTDGTGTSTGSLSHATTVGARQYGNTTSIAGGVTDVTLYDANDWITRVLAIDTNPIFPGAQRAPPATQDFSVVNHSYISNGSSTAVAVELNRRMDLLADRDNVTMVVGANNGAGNALPQLFAHSYNTITVGRTDGNHSHGLTTLNGPGRVKPEIVAPLGATSFATPAVSAAATLLRQQGAEMGGGNAIQNEVTKAVLLAGATKDEFPAWSNTSTQPLDLTFGAGELNIYNSYHILAGGEFGGGATPVTAPAIAHRGWDYEDSLAATESLLYDFSVAADSADASVILTWNAAVSDSGGVLDYDTFDLANLDLRLYDSTISPLGSLVGQSVSTVDNTEHLFFQGLGTGDYTIEVAGISGTTDFALAWQVTAVPEPSAFLCVASIVVAGGLRRRRRRRRQSDASPPGDAA